MATGFLLASSRCAQRSSAGVEGGERRGEWEEWEGGRKRGKRGEGRRRKGGREGREERGKVRE